MKFHPDAMPLVSGGREKQSEKNNKRIYSFTEEHIKTIAREIRINKA